jgi:hypothetical protein
MFGIEITRIQLNENHLWRRRSAEDFMSRIWQWPNAADEMQLSRRNSKVHRTPPGDAELIKQSFYNQRENQYA